MSRHSVAIPFATGPWSDEEDEELKQARRSRQACIDRWAELSSILQQQLEANEAFERFDEPFIFPFESPPESSSSSSSSDPSLVGRIASTTQLLPQQQQEQQEQHPQELQERREQQQHLQHQYHQQIQQRQLQLQRDFQQLQLQQTRPQQSQHFQPHPSQQHQLEQSPYRQSDFQHRQRGHFRRHPLIGHSSDARTTPTASTNATPVSVRGDIRYSRAEDAVAALARAPPADMAADPDSVDPHGGSGQGGQGGQGRGGLWWDWARRGGRGGRGGSP
ncbi:hypothetical protein F5Y19DRAFT_481134 [Xylariaceae sp. FL1651]|nr:hypothetical protein F5Y19DRAFT_481134 [Xylariaceae sp. FL1651]